MMSRRVCSAVLTLACAGYFAPLHAACPYPPKPELPNGSTATLQEMLAAQKIITQYNADMETYLRCIDAATPKTADITPNLSDAQKQALTKQIELSVERKDAAVTDEQAVVGRFNEAVRTFKARQPL
jgi:hypothetical protein